MNTENQPAPDQKPMPHPSVIVQSLTPGGLPALSPPSARAASGIAPDHVREADQIATHDVVLIHESPAPKRSILSDYWRKIGGGSLTLSLFIHVGLIALFIKVVSSTTKENHDPAPPIGFMKPGKTASQEHSDQAQTRKLLKMVQAASRIQLAANGNHTLNIPEKLWAAPEMPFASPSPDSIPSTHGQTFDGKTLGPKSPVISGPQTGTPLPPFASNRCDRYKRLDKLKENGGTPECEKAVSNALEYLKSRQNPDGSWGTANKGAMTGFALLCYLGRCETPDSTFYGEQVTKGILYLIELSKKNSDGLMAEKIAGNSVPYEHGIATYALGEMYSLYRLGHKPMPGMREAFETGVKAIIKYQHPDGSWVYGNGSYAASGREDLSVTGWQYQALKSAKLSGLKIDKLHSAIDSTIKYLQSRQTTDGGFGTTNREGSYNQWNLTGVGVLGLQTLGAGHGTEIKKGIKFSHAMFAASTPGWSNANLYSWYYYAQAFFQNGGPEWKHWNETAMPAILANQNQDGSWTPKLKPAEGGTAGGDGIYSTALCTLMLEVYYRYLQVGPSQPKIFQSIDG